jgi:hypothetical protein
MFALQLQHFLMQGSVWNENICEVTEKVLHLFVLKQK